MTDEEFQKYLEERYEDQVNWYDTKAIQNQNKYKMLQFGVIILSAITPVLIAVGNSSTLKYLAVVVSFLVAAGTTLLKTFKYQENWINYRTTCETLRKEIYLLNAKIDVYKGSNDPRGLFVERVEALISRENTYWLKEMRQEEEKDTKKNR